MRRSTLHIVIGLLLAVLYVGERAMPCMEICVDECAAEYGADHHAASNSQDRHDDSAPSDPGHHCGHCSCPCHSPALSMQGERVAPFTSSNIGYASTISRLPSASVHPPDHIPLV